MNQINVVAIRGEGQAFVFDCLGWKNLDFTVSRYLPEPQARALLAIEPINHVPPIGRYSHRASIASLSQLGDLHLFQVETAVARPPVCCPEANRHADRERADQNAHQPFPVALGERMLQAWYGHGFQ